MKWELMGGGSDTVSTIKVRAYSRFLPHGY